MRLVVRIHGFDMAELKRAEALLRRIARENGLKADIFIVNEYLEHGRLGIADSLPAVEVNGFIVSRKTQLTESHLRILCASFLPIQQPDPSPSSEG